MDSLPIDRKAPTADGSRRTSFLVWAILLGGVCCFAWAATQAAQRIGGPPAETGRGQARPAATAASSAVP
jgi:hypothetical protein